MPLLAVSKNLSLKDLIPTTLFILVRLIIVQTAQLTIFMEIQLLAILLTLLELRQLFQLATGIEITALAIKLIGKIIFFQQQFAAATQSLPQSLFLA